jgi:hypothetical protein
MTPGVEQLIEAIDEPFRRCPACRIAIMQVVEYLFNESYDIS